MAAEEEALRLTVTLDDRNAMAGLARLQAQLRELAYSAPRAGNQIERLGHSLRGARRPAAELSARARLLLNS
jgi:hypothetical protein